MQRAVTRRNNGGFTKNLPWLIVGVEMGLLVVMLIAAVVGLGALIFYSTDRILPGVSALGVELGTQSVDEAAEALRNAWTLGDELVLRDGARTWRFAPAELGLELDAAETALRAQRVGRGDDGLTEALASLFGGHEVSADITIDVARARAGLERLAEYANIPAQDATIRVVGTEVQHIGALPGREIDIENFLSYLAAPDAAGAAFYGGVLDLMMVDTVPPITDASAVVAQAQQILGQPFDLKAYDPFADQTLNWEIDAPTLAAWLAAGQSEDGQRVVLSLNDEALTAYLQTAEASLGEGRTIDIDESRAQIFNTIASGSLSTTLRVRSTPVQHTVQHGDTFMNISRAVGIPVLYLTQANPNVDPHNLHVGDVINIPSREMMLPLPVVPGKRIVIDIGDLRMYVYQNGELIQNWPTSTGIDESPTLTGVFQIRTHEVNAYASIWDLYMPHFMGVYEAAPGFMNGIHGLPTRGSHTLIWSGALGNRRTSYGCIVLGLDEAEWLYNWAEEGVIVEIRD